MIVTVLAYAADAAILATYGLAVHTGRMRPFHLANAIGAIPLVISELLVGAWPPMVLTVAFGAIGAVGLVRDRARDWTP